MIKYNECFVHFIFYIPLCMLSNRKNNSRYSYDCAPFARTDRKMSDRVLY